MILKIIVAGITLFCHIFFLALTQILYISGYDILPLVFEEFPLWLTDDVDYLRGLAWDNRNDKDNNMVNRIAGEGAITERSLNLDVIQVIAIIII